LTGTCRAGFLGGISTSGMVPAGSCCPAEPARSHNRRRAKGGRRQTHSTGRGWRMPMSSEGRIRLRCRRPFGGECTSASCCLTGSGASLVDVGVTREAWLPPDPGKGMSGQSEVYRPLADGKIVCTSPGRASTVRAGGIVNARKSRALSCLIQTTVHLVRLGTCHCSMVQVRGLAGWLSARRLL
jgi:hypothetical protein